MATSTVLLDKLVNGIFRRHLLVAHRNGTSSDACKEAQRKGDKAMSSTGIPQQRASLNSEHSFSIPTFLQEVLHFLI